MVRCCVELCDVAGTHWRTTRTNSPSLLFLLVSSLLATHAMEHLPPLQLAMLGAGEYTTGYVQSEIKSDKKLGVVGLVLFDLRRRGMVGKLSIAATSGSKWDAITEHFG